MRQLVERNLISVIMPCYNAASFVRQAVESALGQSYPDVELVVVDDGSSDESLKILEELKSQYAGRVRIFQQENKGPYPARNLGLSHARGEYIAFLDADDYWDSDCLRRLYDTMHGHAADISYCGWQNIHESGNDRDPYIPPSYEEQDIVAAFLNGCPWPIHAALTRRNIIDSVNGFSERYHTSMDYDLWLRILKYTRSIVRTPEVLAYYRWHDKGQISSVKWLQILHARDVRQDFVNRNSCLVKHISRKRLRKIINASLLQSGYQSFWKRDLESAWHLFRMALIKGVWTVRDLKYILPSLLPYRIYARLVEYISNA